MVLQTITAIVKYLSVITLLKGLLTGYQYRSVVLYIDPNESRSVVIDQIVEPIIFQAPTTIMNMNVNRFRFRINRHERILNIILISNVISLKKIQNFKQHIERYDHSLIIIDDQSISFEDFKRLFLKAFAIKVNKIIFLAVDGYLYIINALNEIQIATITELNQQQTKAIFERLPRNNFQGINVTVLFGSEPPLSIICPVENGYIVVGVDGKVTDDIFGQIHNVTRIVVSDVAFKDPTFYSWYTYEGPYTKKIEFRYFHKEIFTDNWIVNPNYTWVSFLFHNKLICLEIVMSI